MFSFTPFVWINIAVAIAAILLLAYWLYTLPDTRTGQRLHGATLGTGAIQVEGAGGCSGYCSTVSGAKGWTMDQQSQTCWCKGEPWGNPKWTSASTYISGLY